MGGWNSNLFFNYFDPNLNSLTKDSTPESASLLDGRIFYPTGTSVEYNGAKFAPGMKFWTSDDLGKSCIWRGALSPIGHELNWFFYSGGTSPYLTSYSSLIAAYQAQTRGTNPLVYVKVGDAPAIVGTATGYAVPSHLDSHDDWKKLTTPRSSLNATSSQLINDAVAELSAAAKNRVSMKASKGLSDGFLGGYSGAQLLTNSNFATGPEFIEMWFRYFKAMQKEAQDHSASGLGSYGTGTYGIQVKTLYANIAALDVPNAAALVTLSNADYVITMVKDLSWRFAMAAFMVIKDLSYVVDVRLPWTSVDPSGDTHENAYQDYRTRIFALAGSRELIRHLSSIPNPEVSGKTMLDCTLITHASEFDRAAYLCSDGLVGQGTTHNNSFSMLLAGHRSNAGKVFGTGKIGDSASVIPELRYSITKPTDMRIVASNWFGTPIGHDPVTGLIDPAKSALNPYGVFFTILKMFNCPVPPQQITGQEEFAFLRKPA